MAWKASAVIVAAALVAGGEDLASALRLIKTSRGADVPETREQRHWLEDFATSQHAAQATDVLKQPFTFGSGREEG